MSRTARPSFAARSWSKTLWISGLPPSTVVLMSVKRSDADISCTTRPLTRARPSRSYPEISICSGLANDISAGRLNSYWTPGMRASSVRMASIAASSSARPEPGCSAMLNVPVLSPASTGLASSRLPVPATEKSSATAEMSAAALCATWMARSVSASGAPGARRRSTLNSP